MSEPAMCEHGFSGECEACELVKDVDFTAGQLQRLKRDKAEMQELLVEAKECIEVLVGDRQMPATWYAIMKHLGHPSYRR